MRSLVNFNNIVGGLNPGCGLVILDVGSLCLHAQLIQATDIAHLGNLIDHFSCPSMQAPGEIQFIKKSILASLTS